VGVHEVKWGKGGTVRAKHYIIFYRKANENYQLRTEYFSHHRIVSPVKRVEFASDRLSHIILRGSWCNIIVLNVHAQSEDKSDDSKESFYEKLEQSLDHFTKYHSKILLGSFKQIGRENVFKTAIEN
jgi:hypothetical protein